jgi:Lipocalin-like domain
MKSPLARNLLALLVSACSLWTSSALADKAPPTSPLAGTWILVAADVQHPDGSVARDFGAKPNGLLLIDNRGRYSLQIFKAERPPFAQGDKAKGTDNEYKAAVMGSSTHFGTITVESASGTLVFHIQGASFPNWEGQQQSRYYELKDNVLSYRVTPRPNGDVPISVWRRID